MNRFDGAFVTSLEPELRALDEELRCAMAAPVAPGLLVARVVEAAELRDALRLEAPAGLTQQIFEATADRLERPAVLPWLGWAGLRFAAAVLLLASLSAAILSYGRYVERGRVAQTDTVLADIALRQFAMDADLAGSAILGMEARTLDLAFDIEQFAWAIEDDAIRGPLGDGIDVLADELLIMETQSDLF